jgi:hypothetical protein
MHIDSEESHARSLFDRHADTSRDLDIPLMFLPYNRQIEEHSSFFVHELVNLGADSL